MKNLFIGMLTLILLAVSVFYFNHLGVFSLSKNKESSIDNLTLCIIDRNDFKFSDVVKELIIDDVKKFGGWSEVEVLERKAQPPEEYKYFFPTKGRMDRWVDEVVDRECGKGYPIIKIIYAGLIENDVNYEHAWGYARKGKNIAVILLNIEDARLGPEKIRDFTQEAAILHEVGHLWGLGHNNIEGCLMNDRFESIKYGDREFNESVTSDYKNIQSYLPEQEGAEWIRKKYNLIFCDYEKNLLKEINSPLLGFERN